jgi:hypothetical protein
MQTVGIMLGAKHHPPGTVPPPRPPGQQSATACRLRGQERHVELKDLYLTSYRSESIEQDSV